MLGVCFLGACRELAKLLRTLSDPLRGLLGRAGAGLCRAAWAQAWQGGLAEVEVAGRCHLPSASGRPEPGARWQSGLCPLVHRGVPFPLWAARLLWAVFLSGSLTPSRPGAQMYSRAEAVERSPGCSRSRRGQQGRSEAPRLCPSILPAVRPQVWPGVGRGGPWGCHRGVLSELRRSGQGAQGQPGVLACG